MNKDLEYISIVEKLSQKGFAFHKRLLLLYSNRLSYFSQVPAEAHTEDFNPSKALTLGLKQKAFICIENIISISPVEDQVLKKKKKKHMFIIHFPKEALNNFSSGVIENNPKSKPLCWTFAIQQTEEYKKWLEVITLARNRIRDNGHYKENVMKPPNPLKVLMFQVENKGLISLEPDLYEKDKSTVDQVLSKQFLDQGKKPSFDETSVPEVKVDREAPKDLQVAEVGTKRQRLSSADKLAVEQATQKLTAAYAGKKKETHLQKEIFKKKFEEEQKGIKEPEISEKVYRKAIMNEVFKGSWEAKFNLLLDRHLKCLDNFDDLIDSEFKLLKLMREFCSRAIDTCKLIVDELHKPAHERTHKAIQITALEKDPEIPEIAFMLNNCIIKMTWTVGGLEEISESGEYYLYNEKTVKAYGNEFRALNILTDCTYLVNRKYRTVNFRVPLSIIVDYKGFRCLVISSPPINGEETLVAGPAPNEGTYKVCKPIEDDLKFIAENLNLKEHKFSLEEKGASIDIPLSIFVEVHKTVIDLTELEGSIDSNMSQILSDNGKTNNEKKEMGCHYLMNTAEIVPIDIDIDASGPASFLRRLRPEYVLSCDTPLSADAFINQAHTPESQREDFEVIQAGKALQQEVIQNFVERLEAVDILPFDSASLTNAFHLNGINMRYLGVVSKKITLPHVKGLCIQEMISRSAKKILRKQLSEMTMKEAQQEQPNTSALTHNLEEVSLSKHSSQAKKIDPKSEIIVDFLNLLFGTGKESEKFWWGVLNKQILYDFGYQLKRNQKNELMYGGLLASIAYHCNVRLAIDEELEKSLGKALNPFKKEHIRSFIAKPKMYQLEKLDIRKLEEKCKDALESKHHDLAIKLCELLISSERALQIESRSMKELGYLEQLAEIYLEVKDLDKASEIATEALREFSYKEIDAVKFLTIIMKIHMMKGESDKVEGIFYEIISYLDFNLGNYHPLHSSIYSMVGYYYVEKTQYTDALVLYRSSLVCLKKILGDDHPYIGETLSELGSLSVKMGKSEEALEYYNKALNVYLQRKDQDSLETANICTEMAKILLSLGSLRDTMAVVDKALGYYEDHEEDHYENIVQCTMIGMQVNEIVCDWEKALQYAIKTWNMVVQYEVEDLYEILNKLFKSTFNAFVHSQNDELKRDLLSAFEALERSLVESGEISREKLARGNENVIKGLYDEVYEAGKEGLELQDWFLTTFESVLDFLKSTPVEAFFNKNYRQNIAEETDGTTESCLKNFERLLVALGSAFIYKTFQNS